MESTTGDSCDAMLFQRDDSPRTVDCFEVSMTELSSILLRRRATPSVEITVLIDGRVMIITRVDLDGLNASQACDRLWFVCRPRQLDDGLSFKEAKNR